MWTVALLLLTAATGLSASDFQLDVSNVGEYVVVEVSSRENAAPQPRIISAVACTAVDLNVHDGALCNTEGFKRIQVLPAPEDVDVFSGKLWKDNRLLLRARTVKDDWPLLYLELTLGTAETNLTTRMLTRVSRDVRERAALIEKGQVSQLGVLGPVTSDDGKAHVENRYQVLALSFVGVFLAGLMMLGIIRGRLKLRWRQWRQRDAKVTYDGRHYQLLLLGESPGKEAARTSMSLKEIITGEKPESASQRETREKREQLERDRKWGSSRGLIAPPTRVLNT